MRKYLSKKNKDQENKSKLNAIAYLVESGYDLLLSSHCNVSESPGFESFFVSVRNEQNLETVFFICT